MTTTTELALVENIEPQDLTEKEAKVLDKKIRTASDRVETNFNALLDLLEKAAVGQIHKALGLSSWTAYVKDAVQISVADKWERKALVNLMSGKGMSQRAIASALGTSQMTVSRDLDEEGDANDSPITGLDGKTYQKRSHDEDVIDAEVVEDESESESETDSKPTPAIDLVNEFNEEVANLWAAYSSLDDIVGEEKWPGARRRAAKANLNQLGQIAEGLQAVIDNLMGE